MKTALAAVAALTLGLSSSTAHAAPQGCDFQLKKQELCASLEWRSQPAPSRPSEFRLRFWDPSKGSQSGPFVRPQGAVGVKLWMPSMGHGSRPVKVEEISGATGVYDATNVIFIMGGPWEIWVQLKNGSEILDQSKVDFEP